LLECLRIEYEGVMTSRNVAKHSFKDSSLHQGRSETSKSPRCVLTSLNTA